MILALLLPGLESCCKSLSSSSAAYAKKAERIGRFPSLEGTHQRSTKRACLLCPKTSYPREQERERVFSLERRVERIVTNFIIPANSPRQGQNKERGRHVMPGNAHVGSATFSMKPRTAPILPGRARKRYRRCVGEKKNSMLYSAGCKLKACVVRVGKIGPREAVVYF